jgi:phosphoribosylanthranilate isomerase
MNEQELKEWFWNIYNNCYIFNLEEYKHIDYFLLDNKNPGSGEAFDWKILQDFNPHKPYFLSGGINIKNIEEAIKIVNPKFIDLSSGIEEIKGVKSSKLIIEILQKIKINNQKN